MAEQDGQLRFHGGAPLGERESHFSFNESTGVGANVQTLSGSASRKWKNAPSIASISAPVEAAPLDEKLGGLSLHPIHVGANGVPDLSNNATSPTTTAESSVHTPPASALTSRSDVDLLKPAVITRSDSVTTTEPGSADHSAAASEDEGPAPVKPPRSPTKQASVSSVATVVPHPAEPKTPSRVPSATSPPLVQSSPKPPHLEKKTSAIGKLFHHKGSTPSGSANASTTSLARGPPPSKSAGARSPALHSGDESDGGHSESSATSSAGGALRALGRRMSSNKQAAPSPRPDDGKLPERRPSTKRSTSQDVDGTGKLERKTSTKAEKAEGGGHMTLKDYVAAHSGGLMSRKASHTSHHSDDGRSDKGSDHDDTTSNTSKKAGSIAGGGTTASLLKKYGVCEKVAIGKGATAVVRLAHKWDRSTERLYAVKEFRKRRKNETEREYVKKLTSEFCISSTLHHAHVVETVDLVQDENHHWCEVMEYCPGGDLYAAIKKGNMSQKVINSYFKQMLLGVAYLHSMGVAHRDIKPENLLLDAKGYIKITDFGVSDVFRMCWEKSTHLSKGLCGSEPYIAPEQFEQKEYDARMVDVWACAIVFYCMVAQELPWRAARASDQSFLGFCERYDSSGAPAPISTLTPKECRPLVKKMLNPNPKERIMIEATVEDKWIVDIPVVESTPPMISSSAGMA